MIDTVVNIGYFIVLDISEGNRRNGKLGVWIDGEDGEGLVGVGDVGVVDMLREFHDHELTNRVLYVNAFGNAIVVEGEVIVRDGGDGGCQRYQAEDKSRGDGGDGARGGGGGGDIVHDVAGGIGKFKACNFEGHKMVAGRLKRRESLTILYLYSVSDDQGGCVTSSENDGQDNRDCSKG